MPTRLEGDMKRQLALVAHSLNNKENKRGKKKNSFMDLKIFNHFSFFLNISDNVRNDFTNSLIRHINCFSATVTCRLLVALIVLHAVGYLVGFSLKTI